MSISLETFVPAHASATGSAVTGHFEVQELPDRVRYVLSIEPPGLRIRRLCRRVVFLGLYVATFGLFIWGLPGAISSAETWLGVAWHLFLGSQLLGLCLRLGSWEVEGIWISLMQWMGERAEIEVTWTTLRATYRLGWIKETYVVPIWQVSSLEASTMTGFGEQSGIHCKIDGRGFRLAEQANSRPLMIALAQDLGQRLKVPVSVSDPVSFWALLAED